MHNLSLCSEYFVILKSSNIYLCSYEQIPFFAKNKPLQVEIAVRPVFFMPIALFKSMTDERAYLH